VLSYLKLSIGILGYVSNMKKLPLVLLGIAALVCSRAVFFFINDPEGPNLLIVVVLAAVIYAVFVGFYMLVFVKRVY